MPQALAMFRRLDRYIVPVLILAGWEAFSRSGALPAALLPAPSTVAWAWADWVFGTDGNTQTYSGNWLFDMLASLSRVLAGFAIATALAVSIGVAIGWSRTVEVIIEPTLQTLRPIPPVSWIPLAIIWFGIANKPAIFLVFLGAFFPILLNTIHGVKTCDRNLIRAGAHGRRRQSPTAALHRAAGRAAQHLCRSADRHRLGLDADGDGGDGRCEKRPRLCAVGFLIISFATTSSSLRWPASACSVFSATSASVS